MKNLSFVLIIAFLGLLDVNAQSVKFGTFMIHVEPGLSLHRTSSEFSLFGQPAIKSDDGALSVHFGLGLELGLGRFLSIGVFGDYIDFVEDPGVRDPDQEWARAFAAGPMVNLYFINKDDFNLFYSLGLGVSALKIKDEPKNDEFDFVGTHFRTGLGFRHFFNSTFALTGRMMFSFHDQKIDKFVVSGTEVDVESETWKLKHAGLQIAMGLTIKL